jgi:hypothetical protein
LDIQVLYLGLTRGFVKISLKVDVPCDVVFKVLGRSNLPQRTGGRKTIQGGRGMVFNNWIERWTTEGMLGGCRNYGKSRDQQMIN